VNPKEDLTAEELRELKAKMVAELGATT